MASDMQQSTGEQLRVAQSALEWGKRACDTLSHGHNQMQVFFAKGTRPRGFPRGEFVAEYEYGNAYAVECQKVIKWVDRIVGGVDA